MTNPVSRRSIKSNFTHLISGHMIGKAASFLVFLLIARFLGVDKFGRLSYLVSLVGIFSLLPDFGTSGVSIREAAGKSKDFIEDVLSRVLSLKLILSALTVLVIFSFASIFNHLSRIEYLVFLVLSGAMIFDSLTIQLRAVTNIFERMEYEAFSIVLEGILRFFLILLLLSFMSVDILKVSVAFFISSALTFLITALVVQSRFISFRIRFNFHNMRDLIIKGAPFAFLILFQTVNFKIDMIMVRHELSTFATGLYAACARIMESLLIIPVTFTASVFPVFSRLRSQNKKQLSALYYKSYIILVLIGAFLSIAISLSAKFLVPVVLGKDYRISGLLISKFCFLLIPFFLRFFLDSFLLAVERTKVIFIFYLVGFAGHIFINKILLLKVSLVSTVYANLFSSILIVAASMFYIRKNKLI